MKKLSILTGLIILILGNYSCEPVPVVAKFKDMRELTITDYIDANKTRFSSFESILQKGKLFGTLSAYNPHGLGYTLFLPDNNAIDKFISESGTYKSLADMLNDSAYIYQFCRYHVLNAAYLTNDFPFGAFPQLTLTQDYLTVSFVAQKDTSYYLINNTSPVTQTNIELSNGYIQVIGSTLKPITFTSYGWLSQHPGYSIFLSAIDITGLKDTININTKSLAQQPKATTMLIEHDSVYNKRHIYSLTDLENFISPGNSNYTSTLNPLYNYVAYHILNGSRFLDKLFGFASNYSTYSDVPLNINGLGNDLKINLTKENFDTLVHLGDTTIVNWVGFNYDASNIVTQSGVIHFIDQVLRQQTPSRATQTYEFWEEPLLNLDRLTPGTYLIENHASLTTVAWSGADLYYVKKPDIPGVNAQSWSNDYMLINGDFRIAYTIPKVIQGKYLVYLQAEAYNSANATVEIYIDGLKIGQLFDLSSGGSASSPFIAMRLGTIEFTTYQAHTVEVRSLIPGRFCWDYVQFIPN